LLGSTPSIETYFNGKSGKWFSRNQGAVRNVMMPDIKLVDLKDKYFRKKNERPF
jgi:primosomal protein N' (replication factor Y)